MTMLDLLIFDMDGVLHDSERLSAIAVCDCLAQRGIQMGHKELELRYGGQTFEDIADNLARDLQVDLGSDFARASAERWVALFDEALTPTPGVADFLDAIQGLGLQTCLASNSARQEIDSALAISGLARFFAPQDRFSGMEVAAPKPAPDLHRACLASYGVARERALVFEDSLTGAGGGVAAGVPVFGYVGVHPRPAAQAAALLELGVGHCFEAWSEVPRERQALADLIEACQRAR